MHGKNSKFATAALSALLYTQALLIAAGVALVVVKDRAHAGQALQPALASVLSLDAAAR